MIAKRLVNMNRGKIAKTLVLGTLIVSLYIVIVLVSRLGRRSSQSWPWKMSESLTNTTEYDGPSQPKNMFKGLNQHTWEQNCLKSLEQLCNYPMFPKAPDRRTFADNININSSVYEIDGLRFFGFLRPNRTGEYLFLVASNGFAEVWISTNEDWKNAKKITFLKPSMATATSLDSVATKSVISKSVHLVARQTYYIEVIYAKGAQKTSGSFIQVAWKRPQRTDKTINFEIIDKTFFSPYTNNNTKTEMKVCDEDLPEAVACRTLRLTFANKYMKPETLPILESTAVSRALDYCEYRPSYILNPANLAGFGQYQGVTKHAHKTYSFPYTNVDGIMRDQAAAEQFKAENPLEETVARSIINRYMAAIEKSYPG